MLQTPKLIDDHRSALNSYFSRLKQYDECNIEELQQFSGRIIYMLASRAPAEDPDDETFPNIHKLASYCNDISRLLDKLNGYKEDVPLSHGDFVFCFKKFLCCIEYCCKKRAISSCR